MIEVVFHFVPGGNMAAAVKKQKEQAKVMREPALL